ncbi:unnamed protein product [Angiostrongylus costaricensis]|uniref:Secreted protein n=1 Tax=Angiostrongylus costaricensis TaxID=334426 RepID=A0A0R3PVM3_ANGCS|nr:unnamed protein product [Angiostrongylus costaricensis]
MDVCGFAVCLLVICVRYMEHFNTTISTIPPILHFYWACHLCALYGALQHHHLYYTSYIALLLAAPHLGDTDAVVGPGRSLSTAIDGSSIFLERCQARTVPHLPGFGVFPTLSLSSVRIIPPLVPPPRSLSDFIPQRFDVCRVVCFCRSARSAFIRQCVALIDDLIHSVINAVYSTTSYNSELPDHIEFLRLHY